MHMHTNVILTNKRRTHAQSNYTNTKLGLAASYAIRPGNGVGLFYTGTPPDPHRGTADNNTSEQKRRPNTDIYVLVQCAVEQ